MIWSWTAVMDNLKSSSKSAMTNSMTLNPVMDSHGQKENGTTLNVMVKTIISTR